MLQHLIPQIPWLHTHDSDEIQGVREFNSANMVINGRARLPPSVFTV
jgi:hypothetical protein